MYFLNNFRCQVTFAVSLAFILFWGGGLLLFNYYLLEDLEERQQVIFEINKDKLNSYLTSVVNKSSIILKKISKQISQEITKNNTKNIVKKINKIWHENLIDYDSISLSFYDKKYEIHNISSDKVDFFSSRKSLGEKILKKLNLLEGSYFFHCQDSCDFYYIKPLSNYSLNEGILQVRIPIDDILNGLLNKIDTHDIFIFKKTNNSGDIKINSLSYVLEATSSFMLFKKIIKNRFLIDNENIIKDKKNEYTINIMTYGEIENIIFATIYDTSHQNKKMKYLFRNYFIISTVIILVVILLFNLLLKKPMARINLISKILGVIGTGDFKHAQRLLEKNKRKNNYDELDNIHNSTCLLTNQLKCMHSDLEKSNNTLIKKVKEVSYMADHDTLTGVFNRRRFKIELNTLSKSACKFILVSMDLNHFKLVNDSMGHAIGDRLLQLFANVLVEVVSDKGIIGRMGGDEFSIILLGHDHISQTFDELATKISKIKIENNLVFKVSSSIGAAIFPDDSSCVEELSAFSDAAMYENKRFKTSHYNLYTGEETLIQEEKNAQYWNKVINDSLKNNTLMPFFQPIIRENNSQIYSYEVLARIKLGSHYLSPSLYMEHLEKSRVIIKFDRLIFDLSLRKFSKNENKPKLMINLSYYTISSIGIIDYILNKSREYNYPPSKIVFEVTERIEISDIKLAKKFLSKLKKYGFKFALDDFGAGFSSFFYLTELPIDYLKIDKKITSGLISNPTDHHVIQSIVLLAKNLQIKIIAEGIDSPELLNIVKRYDIDLLQGYYFAKPHKSLPGHLSRKSYHYQLDCANS